MKIPKNWTFDNKEVADNFDAHVREQLPWYEMVTNAVAHIAATYLPEKGHIYDIGASKGNISLALTDVINARGASIDSIEPSDEMVKQFVGTGNIIKAKAQEHVYYWHDVSISFLTTMFIPVPARQALFNKMYKKLQIGGAMIFVEKTFPQTPYSGIIHSRLIMSEKKRAGASLSDIAEKELSLSGVQVPVDITAYPVSYEFFRYGDFVGWVVEKNESI